MTDLISFPPLHDLAPNEHEARTQHLLSEIAREPNGPSLFLPNVPRFQRPRSRRSVVIVAAALAALVCAGVAIAASLGAFNGIEAAQHSQTAGDVVDPATAAYLKDHLVGIQLDTARHIGHLPDGQNIYVITGRLNDLCTIVGPPNAEVECGDPLSRAHPATIFTYPAFNNDAGTRWITFGVALDGVTSVSFPYSTQATPAEGGGPRARSHGVGQRQPLDISEQQHMAPDRPPTCHRPLHGRHDRHRTRHRNKLRSLLSRAERSTLAWASAPE